MTQVHPTAVIDDGAVLGSGVRVWHWSHVSPTAIIGADTTLGQNVYVGDDVWIGKRCKVQNNVSLYTGVVLEDDVFVGPSAVFTNVRNPRAAFPTDDYRPTLVARGVTIGANATVVCGATLGEWSFIGAGAVVAGSVLAHALMVGVPARRAGWMCVCGIRLVFNGVAVTCLECGAEYGTDLERVWRT